MRALVAACFLLVVSAGSAHASLLGDEIEGIATSTASSTFNYLNDTFNPIVPAPATVTDPGVEYQFDLNAPASSYTLDIAAETVTLELLIGDSVLDVGTGGWTITLDDLDWDSQGGAPGTIVGFNQTSSDFRSCPSGAPLSTCGPSEVIDVDFNPTFGPDSLGLDWDQVLLTYRFQEPFGDQRAFQAVFEIVTTHSAVPEPTTLSLHFIGFGAILLAARRRRAA